MISKNDKILITGASGFIGTNFAKYLIQNNVKNFINIDKSPPLKKSHLEYWHECNILNKDNLKKEFYSFQPDFVLHLAARADCEGKSLDDYIDNTIGTENVIDIVKKSISVKRLIITSTQYVYRPGDKQPSHYEDYDPHTVYGESKVLNEKAIRKANLNCIWTIIRPVNIWGPWHLRYRDQFLKILSKGKYLHPNSKKVIKTYGYVGNVVNQIWNILNATPEVINKQVFYLGDQPVELIKWVNCFSQELLNRDVRVVPNWIVRIIALLGDMVSLINGSIIPLNSSRYQSMTQNYITNIDKTFKVFGKPPYSLEEGVKKTVEWLKSKESGAEYI